MKKRFFTKEEVAKHNTTYDCWLIAHGKVYDVTEWLSDHPAEQLSILNHAGQDSTIDYNFHPRAAKIFWERYCIGYLENQRKLGKSSCPFQFELDPSGTRQKCIIM